MRLTIDVNYFDAFQESKHPRGQPENAGEFAKQSGAKPKDQGSSAFQAQQLLIKGKIQVAGLDVSIDGKPSLGLAHSVVSAINVLPEDHQALLRRQGVRVQLSGDPIRLNAVRMPAYATAHLTPTSGIAGFYQAPGGPVTRPYIRIAGSYILDNEPRRIASAARTTAHELGHAIDDYIGRPSAHPKFEAARQQDIAALTQGERQAASYFLSNERETWAECYAAAYATPLHGGSLFGGMSFALAQAKFSNSIAALDALLAQRIGTASRPKRKPKSGDSS